jgi:biotin synthase
MGESKIDRDELLRAITSLNPSSVPLNFYHPNDALPIKSRNISYDEALEIIRQAREMLGDKALLMVAGGRELLFNQKEQDMYQAGANAIVIGNYLTTKGADTNYDIITLKQLGYKVATFCDTQ